MQDIRKDYSNMIKSFKKDITEIILISALWLAPAVRALVDYRTVVAVVCFIAILAVLFFSEKKLISFVAVAGLLIIGCIVYDSCFFTCTGPAIMLYIGRYFLFGKKTDKASAENINPLLTGAVILFFIQTVLSFIRTSVDFKITFRSVSLYLTAILLAVLIMPFILSFAKNNKAIKKDAMRSFRSLSLCTVFGFTVTSYYFFISNGFNNYELYTLKLFPWFLFIYLFLKNSEVYRCVMFDKAEKMVEKFVNGENDGGQSKSPKQN